MKYLDYLLNFVLGGGGGGAEPTGSVEITENGTHDVTSYAEAVVDVPPYGEGNVTIRENGTHNVSGKAAAIVNVPNPSTGTLNIDQNGTYDVMTKAAVVVDVPNPSSGQVEITQNGTHDVTDYAEAVVNVQTADPRLNALAAGTMTAFTGDDVTAIKKNLFSGDEAIASISLPNALSVGDNACTSATHLTSVSLPSVTSIGSSAFAFISALTSLTLTACASILDAAFHSDTGLTGLRLPALKTLAVQAFMSCTGLTTADIGDTNDGDTTPLTIAAAAFSGCSALSRLIIRYTGAVATLSSTAAFNGTPIANGTGEIYVPDALVARYKGASNWSRYTAMIKPLSELTA